MANVNLVKSIYTGSIVTSLGEVAAADNAKLPGTLTVGSLAGILTGTAGLFGAIDYTNWTTPVYNAGNFTANGSMTWTVDSGDIETYNYLIIGKTMVVNFSLLTTTVGGTPNTRLQIAIPASKTANGASFGFYVRYVAGWAAAAWEILAGASVIGLATDLVYSNNWSTGTNNIYVRGQVIIPIN